MFILRYFVSHTINLREIITPWLVILTLSSTLIGCAHHRNHKSGDTSQEYISLTNEWPWIEPPCMDDHDDASKAAIENGIFVVDDRGEAKRIKLNVPVCGHSQKTLTLDVQSNVQNLTARVKDSYDHCMTNKFRMSDVSHDCRQSLLIFIHGGLNSYENSLARAVADIP